MVAEEILSDTLAARGKRRQRERARQEGKCAQCCVAPPEFGLKTCEDCLRKLRLRRKEINRLAQLAREAGLA